MVGCVLILEYLSGEFGIVVNDAGAGTMLRLRVQWTSTEQRGRDASPMTLKTISVTTTLVACDISNFSN